MRIELTCPVFIFNFAFLYRNDIIHLCKHESIKI